MKFQMLVATMNRTNEEIHQLIDKNNIRSNVLFINQCGRDKVYTQTYNNNNVIVVEMLEKGLSKSRNMALLCTNADICLIADDDIQYENNIEKNIISAFEQYPNYDIIAFYVERSSRFNRKDIGEKHEVKKFSSLGLMSVQIAFRKKAIIEKEIQFDERFGAGSGQYICGEENIFLMDCLRAGLRIMYIPVYIASTQDNESTWFTGHDECFFKSKGAVFKRLFPSLSIPLIFAFALTKKKEYGKEATILQAIQYMLKGQKEL